MFSGDGSGCEEDSETGKGLRFGRFVMVWFGATQRSLAMEYSVSPMAVSRLIRRESWAHVE